MKKLIVISVLLVLVLGFGVFEAVYMSNYFSGLAVELTEISEMEAGVEEEQTSEAVISRLDKITDDWETHSVLFYLLNNNNVLNNLFDRIVQAKTYAMGGQNVDARTSLDSAAYFAQSIARDIRPVPLNFL